MELADTGVEKQNYNAFERFMFLMIPILFVIVLLGVLLALFDADFRNKALQVGGNVPILKDVLPEPKVTGNSMDDDSIRTIKMTEKIDELEAELAAVKSELAAANAASATQEQTVKGLEDENAQLKQLSEEQLLESEQYTAKIDELASMFSDMTPSKAAPIVQNMNIDEIVLLFASMRSDDRVRIMEKMDPKIAAEATMKLKDNTSVKDLQIAALQARLDEQSDTPETPVSSTLNQDQLSATFESMNAKSAAEMLLKMKDISPSKVIRVLNSVSNEARSGILTEMSNSDEAATATIVTKLMAGS
ncbi:MgtE protein [Paenibacillus sp. LHD-117]|uniref:magnesium transporter MgtE N-terminal domain-containing protein n=1 Tax=Paenibacillus sp. LHD-117 TaxID=3071412 RepID=UPI0027DEF5A6|nr:MgtE protein [Paenibacillus sp. LHD-117]MDQ6419256.1 MgtE protein [Paenibacillus sp. LHD-117]